MTDEAMSPLRRRMIAVLRLRARSKRVTWLYGMSPRLVLRMSGQTSTSAALHAQALCAVRRPLCRLSGTLNSGKTRRG